MFNVMLLDDDVPVVEYMRKLVPWGDLGLQVCAEAYSMAEALERFEMTSPDILITDIGLPDGNGIELARRLRDIRPQLRVVFLTCHEDFQYVKEALRIDADDYIVKDELSLDIVSETLRKAKSKLMSEQEQLEQIAYMSDMKRNRDLLLRQFFNELLHAPNPEGLLEHGRRLGIDWAGTNFAVALFHLDIGDLTEVYEREHVELIQYASYNIASELASVSQVTPFPSDDYLLRVIACDKEPLEAKAALERFMPNLQAKLREYLRVRTYCAMANDTCGLSELGRLMERTSQLFELDYYSCDAAGDKLLPSVGDAAHGSNMVKNLETLATRWVEAIVDTNRSFAHIYLGNIEKAMRETLYETKKVKGWLIRCVQEASVRIDRPLPMGILEDINRTVRLEEAFRIVRWYTDRLVEQSPTPSPAQTNPDLKEINSFIYENIYRNVSAIDIARHLHLNPSYFSRYFKKLTGMIFTDHVHLIKLEEAKRLLANGETAENTAYMLGYSDRAYFSRVFKRYTGTSPSEYKPNTRTGEEQTL